MKHFLSLALAAAFGLTFATSAKVTIDGKPSGAAITRNHSVLVPAALAAKAFGAEITADHEILQFVQGGHRVTMRVGKGAAIVDGRETPMNPAPYEVNGTVYVAPRFLALQFGGKVEWQESLGIVDLGTGNTSGTEALRFTNEAPRHTEPTAAVIPWFLHDCTDGGRTIAQKAIAKALTDRGYAIASEEQVRQAMQKTGCPDPTKDHALPSSKQMLALGKALGTDVVVAGSIDWRYKGVFVFPRGMVTKAYTDCMVRVVDVTESKTAIDRIEVKADSENKSDAAAIASWILLGIPNPFGSAKDPASRRAGAIVVRRALDNWNPQMAIQ